MSSFHIAALDSTGTGLEVRFHRMGDRWSHTVVVVAGERHLPLLASSEGGPSDDWPPSPPLQELHEHQQQGTPMILAVGGAGTAHWSLSAEADSTARKLTFDAACRLSVAPASLGSAYRTMLAAERGRSLHDARLTTELGEVAVRSLPAAETGTADVEITPNGLAIVPAAAELTGPASARWRYTLELILPAGA